MKRADMRPGRSAEGRGPLPHLLGRFVRKGYGTNIIRRNAGVDEGRDAIGDHTRLAAARTGQHEQRSFNVKDGFPL